MKRKYVSMLLAVVLTISTVCQSAYGAKSEETMTQETDSVAECMIEESNAQDLEETVEETSVEEIAEETATEEELTEEVSLQALEASLEDLLEETTEGVIEIAESESEEAAGEESEKTEGTLSETATTEEAKSTGKSVRKAAKQAASAEVRAEGVCGDNLTWVLTTDGVLTISGTGEMWDMSGQGWSDKYWKSYKEEIYSIVIGEGVTNIGSEAFYQHSNVQSVSISDSVKEINEYAFFYCGAITDVIIPDGVTKIGADAFFSCENLVQVQLPDSVKNIEESAFGRCFNLKYVNIPSGIEKIPADVFCNCSLERISIPDSVQEIGYCAFSGNKLTEVTIPDSVQEIGSYAFSGNELTKVTMPKDLKVINWGVFSNNKLTKAIIPNSVQEIGSYAFSGNKLTEVIIPDSVQEIDSYAFSGNELAKVTMPKGLKVINSGVFSNNKLTEVVIPNGVQEIDSNAFASNDFTKITIPNSVQKMGSEVFKECENLIEVKLPDGIISIGDSVFSGCSNLKEVNLPEGITSIPSGTFQECKSLETISLPNSITSIGAYAFYGCNQLTLSLSDNITDIGYRALDGCKVSDRIWVEDAWYSTDMSVLYKVSGGREEFNVPETVTTIESYAFLDCENLSNVILPESVKTIKENAFYGCKNVTGLVISASVTSIGHNVLETCGSYSISKENPNYTVSDGILYNKDMTELLDCPDDKEGEVMIPSTVTTIGEAAFDNCYRLTHIEIPPTVIRIRAYAFRNCSGLDGVLPEQIREIGAYAFKGARINIGGDYSLKIPDTVTSIGSGAFYGIRALTITIPSSVTHIGEMAFGYHNDWLGTDIERRIGTVIKGEIGSEAERYANENEFVFTSPDSDLVISGKCGENVIYELRGTEETGYDLTIRGQGEMYDYLFEKKPYNPEGSRPAWDEFDIKTVKILDGVTKIGANAFVTLNIDRFIIASSVKEMGERAFDRTGKECYFLGDIPLLKVGYSPFFSVGFSYITIFYPANNSTYTDEIKEKYGYKDGYFLTWIPKDMGELQETTVTKGGITSYGSTDTSVAITLLDGDTELDRIQTTEDTYTFTFLSQGTYTLRASKANHVTRDYEITLGSEDIALDINLCPVGDATGDGKVNTRDLNRLYAHVNGTNPLDGYEFACGDVVGTDSTINTRDLNRLYAHISESNLLW